MTNFKLILPVIALLTLSSTLHSEELLHSKEIHIFHTNDILGQIEATQDEDGKSVGGAVCLAYLVTLKRKEIGNFLLLDAGNTIGPDPFARFTNGIDQIKIMNRLGYTAMGLGEMEFMYGPEALNRCIKEAKFPILSANVVYKGTEKYFVEPYFIYNFENVKIGITTVTEIDIPLSTYGFSNLKVDCPAYHLRGVVEIMKEDEGCDLVIVLSNLGQEEDMKLAESIPKIDIIIGGNVRTASPSRVYQSIPHDVNKGVSLFYSTPLSITLGDIYIRLERHNNKFKIHKIGFNSFYLDERTCPSVEIEKEIPGFKEFIEKDIIERWKSKEEMIIGEVEEGEVIKLTDLVLTLMQKQSNAELALCDRGLFGWFLKDIELQGKIKASDIDREIPFDDNLVIVEMEGLELLRIISHHKEQRGTTKELAFLPNLDLNLKKINNRKIGIDEEYIIAVNNYLADRYAGYTMFEDVRVIKETDTKIRGLVLDYIKERTLKGQKISLSELSRWLERTLWKYKIGFSSELSNFSKSKNADSYRNISEFSSSEFDEWKVSPVFSLMGWSQAQTIGLTVIPQYGRRTFFVKDSAYTQESADWVEADLNYCRFMGETSNFYGQVLLELSDLEITPEEEEDFRKGSISSNVGLGYEFSSDFRLSGGLSGDNKLFISGENYGLYLNSNFKMRLFKKIRLSLEGHAFMILKPGEVNYNEIMPEKGDYTVRIKGELKIPLIKSISLKLKPFIYKDTSIGGWAWTFKTFIALDLIHGLLP